MFTGILFRKNNSNGAERFREIGETPNRRGETTGTERQNALPDAELTPERTVEGGLDAHFDAVGQR